MVDDPPGSTKSPGAIFNAAPPRPRRGEAQDEPSNPSLSAKIPLNKSIHRGVFRRNWRCPSWRSASGTVIGHRIVADEWLLY